MDLVNSDDSDNELRKCCLNGHGHKSLEELEDFKVI